MNLPPLLSLGDEAAYRAHYRQTLCSSAHFTHDHIRVHFSHGAFDHAFFESVNRVKADKSSFSQSRAERMNWIPYILGNPAADLRAGWDKKRASYDHQRRVAIVVPQYAVIIQLRPQVGVATFITAFPVGGSSYQKLMQSPAWDRNQCWTGTP